MRTKRTVIPEVPHHIVLRGNNRRRLFSYRREYEQFIFLLGRALKTSGCALHGATLMTNHVHLQVTPPSELATEYRTWIRACHDRDLKPEKISEVEIKTVYESHRGRLERPDRTSAA